MDNIDLKVLSAHRLKRYGTITDSIETAMIGKITFDINRTYEKPMYL